MIFYNGATDYERDEAPDQNKILSPLQTSNKIWLAENKDMIIFKKLLE